jgi:hypothetical protein
MAWETRGGKLYYYRSIRDGERVRKEYIGTGELAESLAHSDESIRLIRKLERNKGREELERLETLAAPVLEIDKTIDILAHATFVAAGYHRHKGEWRRERTTRTNGGHPSSDTGTPGPKRRSRERRQRGQAGAETGG